MNTTDFQRSKHIWFHDVGLLDKKDFFYKKRNWTLSTLTDIREDLGHTAVRLLIKTQIYNLVRMTRVWTDLHMMYAQGQKVGKPNILNK